MKQSKKVPKEPKPLELAKKENERLTRELAQTKAALEKQQSQLAQLSQAWRTLSKNLG